MIQHVVDGVGVGDLKSEDSKTVRKICEYFIKDTLSETEKLRESISGSFLIQYLTLNAAMLLRVKKILTEAVAGLPNCKNEKTDVLHHFQNDESQLGKIKKTSLNVLYWIESRLNMILLSVTSTEVFDDLDKVHLLAQRLKSIKALVVEKTAKSLPRKNSEGVSLLESTTTRPRDFIVKEILETEINYVKSLGVLKKRFISPLRQRSELIPHSDIQTIFSNVEEIVRINEELLSSLLETAASWNESKTIGDKFMKLAPYLKLYTLYGSRYDKAVAKLSEYERLAPFARFLQTTYQLDDVALDNLTAYLIMPIQRIPRYSLLLEQLKNETLPSHPDHENLCKCVSEIDKIASHINENIRHNEATKITTLLQSNFPDKKIVLPTRKYVKDGLLKKICKKKIKGRHFFLFNDCLFYATPQKLTRGLGVENHVLSNLREVNLNKSQVTNIPDDGDKKMVNAFQLQNPGKSFIVLADSVEEKDSWIAAIKTQIMSNCQNGISSDNSAAAPVWQRDKEVDRCKYCKMQFTLIRRRHHCRSCGQVVCGSCSDNRMIISTISSDPVRVCAQCYKEKTRPGANLPASSPSTSTSTSPASSPSSSPSNSPSSSPSSTVSSLDTDGSPSDSSPNSPLDEKEVGKLLLQKSPKTQKSRRITQAIPFGPKRTSTPKLPTSSTPAPGKAKERGSSLPNVRRAKVGATSSPPRPPKNLQELENVLDTLGLSNSTSPSKTGAAHPWREAEVVREKWYWKDKTPNDCSEILRSCEVGSFLVCPLSNQAHSVSYLDEKRQVQRLTVLVDATSGNYVLSSNYTQYSSLHELLEEQKGLVTPVLKSS